MVVNNSEDMIIVLISIESKRSIVDAMMIEYDKERNVIVFFSDIFPARIIFLSLFVSVPYFASNASFIIIELAQIAVAKEVVTRYSLFMMEVQSLLAAHTPANVMRVVLGSVSGLDIFINVSVISGIS